MFSRVNLRFLALFAFLLAITHASLFNPERREEHARRQNGGLLGDLLGGNDPDPTTSDDFSSPTTSPTTIPTSNPPSTTSDPPTTPPTTSPTTSPSTTPPTTSPTTTSTPETSKPTTSPSPTTKQSPTNDDGGQTTIKSTPTVVVVKHTTTVNGVAQETQITTTSSVPVSTSTPQQPGSESTGKGMSATTKRTVIGVVVGIVGAIVLGALLFLAWRIWGRGKNDEDDDDTLSPFSHGTSAQGGSGLEKNSDVGSIPSPFKTTLDQYHNPNVRTNVSSNF